MGKKRKAAEMGQEQQQSSSSSEPSSSLESNVDTDPDVEDSPDSPLSQDLVDVNIEFFDPKPDDFHGSKALLQTFLDDVDWDINGLVEQFLAQTTVGTVVKTAEDESPIGIISAFNIGRYQNSNCMKDIYKFLKHRSGEGHGARQLDRFWKKKAKEVGFIVSERVINLPLELIPPLYSGLFKEISWATEDEPNEELRNSFKFKYFLVLTRVYEEPGKSGESAMNQKRQVHSGDTKDLIFVKPEDEILLKLSSWSFTFPSTSEASAVHQSDNGKQLRLVMGVDAKQIEKFLSELKDLADKS